MNMSEVEPHEKFSKSREFFWPIYSYELKKFLPMCFMMFFILFNYTLLRGSKDALVVSAGGASVLPFLKGYVVLPVSILFVIAYMRLVDLFSREKVFYIVISFFLSFYALFAFFIYPNKEWLHPSEEYIVALKLSYPAFQHFISMFGTWSYSLYYVLAELWGSSMISLLFWQFANDITKTSEAKRFYAMFGLIANIALIMAGLSGKVYYELSLNLAGDSDPYFYTVLLNIGTVLLSGFAIMGLYRWINQNVLTNPQFYTPSEDDKPKKNKKKISIKDSFSVLFQSKYLGMIAVLVICYGISINIIEVLWKNQVGQQFPTPNEYNNFMQNLFIGMGLFTMIIILTSKSVVRKFGWFRGAIATPIIILITGIIFFVFAFFENLLDPIAMLVGTSALVISVWVGAIQNILSKGVKYGLFDPTKEMAYIPLDRELKTKGKAAVDVVGSRLGKAGGGYITSILLIISQGTLDGIAGFLAVFVIIAILIWIYAVKVLSKSYQKKISES